MPDSSPTLAPWRRRLHEIVFEADTPAGKAFDVALLLASC
jgi:voltage-gated potassium channel